MSLRIDASTVRGSPLRVPAGAGTGSGGRTGSGIGTFTTGGTGAAKGGVSRAAASWRAARRLGGSARRAPPKRGTAGRLGRRVGLPLRGALGRQRREGGRDPLGLDAPSRQVRLGKGGQRRRLDARRQGEGGLRAVGAVRPVGQLRRDPVAAGPHDVALDHDVVRPADQQKVLGVVAPQQDQLALAVELVDVDDAEPRLAAAAPASVAPEGEAARANLFAPKANRLRSTTMIRKTTR